MECREILKKEGDLIFLLETADTVIVVYIVSVSVTIILVQFPVASNT
jgi:hypothetical protein